MLYLRGKAGVILEPPGIFKEGYTPEDNTQVILFTDRPETFPGYAPRLPLQGAIHASQVRVSLVATVRNESQSAARWMEGIFKQSRLPDEIVIVDTGSVDGTVRLLEGLSEKSPVPFHILQMQGGNIAQGRNLAIRNAIGEVIAVTDFGTLARPDWLLNLVAPFEIDPRIEVSGGWYEALGQDGKPIRRHFWLDLKNKNPQAILSPSVSIAFKKKAWEKVGGYPEWLTLTGEDTYFDLELKRGCQYWAFVPEARVDWEAPDTLWRHWKKIASWSSGDGETGVNAPVYWHALLGTLFTFGMMLAALLLGAAALVFRQWVLGALSALSILALVGRSLFRAVRLDQSPGDVIWQIGASAAHALGYIQGGRRRAEVTRRRLRGVKGVFFILAVIPMDDTGGGARSGQMAQELVRQGYAVVYIYRSEKAESVELNLRFRHPNLFSYRASRFDLEGFCREKGLELGKQEVQVLVETPHTDWLPLIEALGAQGAKVVNDRL